MQTPDGHGGGSEDVSANRGTGEFASADCTVLNGASIAAMEAVPDCGA